MPQIALTDDVIPSLTTNKRQEEFYDSNFKLLGSFGIRVNAGGRKSFFLIYSLSGQRRRMNIGLYPSLSLYEARARASHFSKQVELGRDPAAEAKILKNNASFKELIGDFDLEHISQKCKPATQLEYRRIIEKELLPIWAKRVCSSISAQDIDALIKRIGGIKKRPTMANRVRALCSRIFSFACERGLMTENPALSTERFETRMNSQRALSLEESRELWLYLNQSPSPTHIALQLILLTGQLPSRVLAMKWSEVQIDTWLVAGDHQQSIHLCPPAVDCIRRLQNPRHSFVFESTNGKHPSQLSRASKKINDLLVIQTEWRPIDLRRTVEVGLRRLGISIDVIARILNQKSLLRRFDLTDSALMADSEAALRLWARSITPATRAKPKRSDAKIIPLFPGKV